MNPSLHDLVAGLEHSARPTSELAGNPQAIPHGKGVYAIWSDPAGWRDLVAGYETVRAAGALPAAVTSTPVPGLCDGPIYLGKAERSLRARAWRSHFGERSTHQSTLRRTLAALLGASRGWTYAPRRGPDADGQPPRISAHNFRLDATADGQLRQWMLEHLRLGWCEIADVADLRAAEADLISALRPPLNLTHAKGPMRDAARAARALIADALMGGDMPSAARTAASFAEGPQPGLPTPRETWAWPEPPPAESSSVA